MLVIACETQLKVPQTELPKYLAVSSFITPDSTMRCIVSDLIPMSEREFNPIINATVTITDLADGGVSELAYNDTGFYRSTYDIDPETGYREFRYEYVGCT